MPVAGVRLDEINSVAVNVNTEFVYGQLRFPLIDFNAIASVQPLRTIRGMSASRLNVVNNKWFAERIPESLYPKPNKVKYWECKSEQERENAFRLMEVLNIKVST